MITIRKVNEVYCQILAETSIRREINERFRYRPKNYQFDPSYRKRRWNGWINFFNIMDNTFFNGLLPDLAKFLTENNYEFEIKGNYAAEEFSEHEALEFIKTLNLPEKYQVRDYQLKYFIKGVRNYRMIGLSPTSSGKSLIMYLFYRYFNRRTLIIVPTTALVNQIFNDFRDYGYQGSAHLIMEGEGRETNEKLIISTYQSIYDEDKAWFDDKEVIIADEVHTFQAKTLTKMMKKTTKTKVRIGVTGTLQEDELSIMSIKASFGPIYKFISTKDLIDRGFSAPVFFKILKLKHLNSLYRENQMKINYQDEINYILNSEERTRFIKNLAISLTGNTFIMFRMKDHGRRMYEEILKEATIPVFYIDGGNSADERLKLINHIETLENSITVCSTVFSTGINIKKLNNLIFPHPSKSRIRTLQSVGRGLRMNPGKKDLTVFDISDDLIEKLQNTTLLHMLERRRMYTEEEFPFKEYTINLK